MRQGLSQYRDSVLDLRRNQPGVDFVEVAYKSLLWENGHENFWFVSPAARELERVVVCSMRLLFWRENIKFSKMLLQGWQRAWRQAKGLLEHWTSCFLVTFGGTAFCADFLRADGEQMLSPNLSLERP